MTGTGREVQIKTGTYLSLQVQDGPCRGLLGTGVTAAVCGAIFAGEWANDAAVRVMEAKARRRVKQ